MSYLSSASPGRRTWSLLWRYGLALLIGVNALVLGAPLTSLIGMVAGTVVDAVIGIGAAFLMRLRHRHALVLTLALMAASMLVFSISGFVLWAFVHLCTRRRWQEIVPAFAFSFTLQIATIFWPFQEWHPWALFAGDTRVNGSQLDNPALIAAWLITDLGFSALLTAWGLYIGARRDLVDSLRGRAETAEREQELQVLAGQAAERNRIAREMHDVIAHRMSLVSMHSGALAHRDDLTPEQTREIARTIQENAHQSLTELRSVLGSLREDSGPQLAPAKPQPTLADVPALVDDARAAGDRVEFTYQVDGDLPAQAGRHAYRIVQEALTNARKHARHAKVSLDVTGDPERGLTIVARNPLGRSGPVPGAGVGLLGLRERAQMVGGTLTHRIDDEGRFELRAWLPW
ncbi:sensor histidine kinase [Enemella sp. A6]|uniref:sensor histidine kinase n=1 Tax=Enemella sp. A6 TaxID=3440152 RepID=UPI003EC079B1